MPFITVQMLAGRTSAQKRELIRGLAQATTAALGVPEEAIRIVLADVSPDDWGVGGRSMRELRQPGDDQATGRPTDGSGGAMA